MTIKHIGSFKDIDRRLQHFKNSNDKILRSMRMYGELGVRRLAEFTPVDTGKTASSWKFVIEQEPGKVRISWINDNITDIGIPVAVLLQYGHGTRDGYYVQGVDYINPALKPVFDEIAKDAWKEVTR